MLGNRIVPPLVVCLALLSPELTGCAALGACDTSDEGNPVQPYREGTTVGGVYMSSPWNGPLLAFPGGKRYDLYHQLGCTPRLIQLWVSFAEQGAQSGSNVAQSAGNMAIVSFVDSEKLTVKNDTCSDMYLLVTATGCSDDADAGTEAGD